MTVKDTPEIEEIDLKRLDKDENYKIRHTGKWWCSSYCFQIMFYMDP